MFYLGRLPPYPQTLFYSGKACEDEHSSLLLKFVTYGRKKFYNAGCTGKFLMFYCSNCYADGHYADFNYAKINFAECYYAKYGCAGRHFAECRLQILH